MIEKILNASFLIGLGAATIRMATPILFATVGEIIAERSGVLNLGVEGTMLMGAMVGFVTAFKTGSLWLGVLNALVIGGIFGLVMAFLTVTLRTRQEISGLSINLLSSGLSFFFFRAIFGVMSVPPHIKPFDPLNIPVLSKIPVIGEIFFQQYALTYIAIILAPLAYIFLFKTNFGLKIRAVGENPVSADTVGVNVYFIRYISLIIGGMLAGIGGAFLSLAQFNMFLDEMTAGRGFIAIALTIFSNWHPINALWGSFLFGGADALQLRLQAVGFKIPYQFFLMLPYVLTILALLGVSKRVKGPAALIIPYKRGER